MVDSELVKKAVLALGVDKPVMSYRVVGNRVELYLLGGSTAFWTAYPSLEDMLTSELRRLAAERKIRGRSKMSRAQLIEALEVSHA